MHYTLSRFCLHLAAFSAVVFAGVLAAQTTPPQTPAGRQLAHWLQAFNSGDRATMQRFISEQFPARSFQTVDADLAFRKQTGGLDLFKIEESTATRTVALVKERDSEAAGAKLILEVEAAEPHRIVRLDLQPGARIPVSVTHLDKAQLTKTLRLELEKRAAADQFAGAVLVAKGGKPIFTGAYGLADRETGVPNKLDTRLRIGSMNKMFTAVATLTLVQAGKLSLDAPLGKYLTDYPNKTLASKVTIHHLLTHTGGTGDIFGPEFMAHRLELRTHQDFVKLFGERDLTFEPGSQWMYSNYGFVLLGAVIEKVSGQSYYDYVRDHVYKPAGMTATGSDAQAPANLAVGYTKTPANKGWLPNTDTLPYRGTAAGGGYTTVTDLLRFAEALTQHKLLNAHYTDLLTTGKVDAMGGKYAYGFIERFKDGVRSFGHGGTAQGMSGDLVVFPDSGYVVVVLANMDPPAAQRVSDFITNRLP